jgi:O-antigen/teichoic acid export membrane protein
MDKYKKLLSNTFIFAIGTFSSKLLTFLLMPFYTYILSTEEYGVGDLISQTVYLLIPLATVGINNSIIRFALEKNVNKSGVLTTGFVTILAGFAVMCCFAPLLNQISIFTGYTFLVYFFILFSSLHSLFSSFLRSLGYVKLYAFDGIARTLVTILLNIVFLSVFHMGVAGYVLATPMADLISSVFLVLTTKLYRHIRWRFIQKKTARAMLKYSLPLIPTTICSWIINISDRYMITYMIGKDVSGIYAVANKIPTILLIIANIFGDAWQMSSVEERDPRAREKFFTNVSNIYVSIAFLVGSFLTIFAKVITTMLASPSFYSAWTYMPILNMATTFACLSNFLGSIYMVEKRSLSTFYNILIGAALNVAMNFWLIPIFGAQGAAFATFTSYFVMFLIKIVHTRKYVKIRWNYLKLFTNSVIMGMLCVVMLAQKAHWILFAALFFICALMMNLSDLWAGLKKLLKR